MPKVAKTKPGTEITIGNETFRFGDDGTRQVSEADIALLEQYRVEGGPAKCEILDEPPATAKSDDAPSAKSKAKE